MFVVVVTPLLIIESITLIEIPDKVLAIDQLEEEVVVSFKKMNCLEPSSV